MAVKCWATWIGLEMLVEPPLRGRASGDADDGLDSLADDARELPRPVRRAGRRDPGGVRADNPGYRSRILPAARG